METATIIDAIVNGFTAFWHSGFFFFIKFLIGVYAAVLFADIVLLLIVRGLGKDLEKTFKGTTMPLTSKKRMRKIWEKIEGRLEGKNVSQYKLAILEADNLVDEILLKIGYEGKNMKERLEKATSKQIEEFDELLEAHQVRNKIIYDKNFIIGKDETRKVLEPYKKFLEDFEII